MKCSSVNSQLLIEHLCAKHCSMCLGLAMSRQTRCLSLTHILMMETGNEVFINKEIIWVLICAMKTTVMWWSTMGKELLLPQWSGKVSLRSWNGIKTGRMGSVWPCRAWGRMLEAGPPGAGKNTVGLEEKTKAREAGTVMHSFNEEIYIEFLLWVRHCSRLRGFSSEQYRWTAYYHRQEGRSRQEGLEKEAETRLSRTLQITERSLDIFAQARRS